MATTASTTAVTQDFTFENPGRTPTANEINTYATELDAGLLTNQQVAFAIASNTDALSNVIPIIRMYEGILGRTPDAGGLAFWAAQERAGTNPFTALVAIAQGFTSSAEFATLYGSATPNPTAFLTALYHNVLGRNPDSAGLTFWLGQLGASPTVATEANVEIGFTQSTEYQGNSLNAIENFLTAAGLAGAYPPTLTGAGGGGGGGIPQTFAMTTGLDTIVGSGAGNDVINAFTIFNAGDGKQHNSLQNGDSISETGNNNVLNFFASGNDPTGAANVIFPAKISGVQTWNIQNSTGQAVLINAGSTFTGLTTLNNINSTFSVAVGAVGFALPQLLTSVNLTNVTGGVGNLTAATIANAALAGTTDTLAINLAGAGVTGAPVSLAVGPDIGANGYEVDNITASGPTGSWLQLGASGTTNTINITTSGAATLLLSSPGGFNALKTINASAATTAVTITGATVLGGGTAGVLATDTVLSSIVGGTGNDNFDLSGAQFTAAAINAMTKVDGGTGTNILDLNAGVVTGTVAITVPANFQTIGVAQTGAAFAGTINMALLGSAVNAFTWLQAQTGLVTINNVPTTLTVNESNLGATGLTIGAVGAPAGTADVFNLNIGAAGGGGADAVGALTTTGEETINIASTGGPGITNTIASITSTATAGGNEIVNLSGSQAVTIAGAVTLTAAGALTQINDTDTGILTLTGGTNVAQVNAATSGGVLMVASDTFFVSNATVAGSAGSVLTGSATAGNTLVGNIGNDTFSVGPLASTIVTGGGADTVKLTAGLGVDHVDIFGGTGAGAGAAGAGTINSITIAATDSANPGWWGLATAGVTSLVTTAGAAPLFATGTGTSADQVVVANFLPGSGLGGDVVDFSAQAWGQQVALTPTAGDNNGLMFGDLAHSVSNTAAGFVGATAGGAAATIQQVASGGTVNAGTNVIEVIGITLANANALAAALVTGNPLVFNVGAAGVGSASHVLMAYQDAGGNTHIADVDILGATAGANATTLAAIKIEASDLVQLTGVAMASLTSANIHFVT